MSIEIRDAKMLMLSEGVGIFYSGKRKTKGKWVKCRSGILFTPDMTTYQMAQLLKDFGITLELFSEGWYSDGKKIYKPKTGGKTCSIKRR